MQLSLVKCGNHKYPQSKNIHVSKFNEQIEIIGPVNGPSAAAMRNLGARVAQGSWVFFLDADCTVDPEKVLNFCYEIEKNNSQLKAVGGIYKDKKKNSYSYIQKKWTLNGINKSRWSPLKESNRLLGGALLVNKQALESVGGFCEKIGWGGEELELIKRFQQKAYKTAVSYRLTVTHKQNHNFLGFLKRAWYQNYKSGAYNFRQTNSKSNILNYFKGPAYIWPSLIVFFTVATTAQFTGTFIYKLGRLWS